MNFFKGIQKNVSFLALNISIYIKYITVIKQKFL